MEEFQKEKDLNKVTAAYKMQSYFWRWVSLFQIPFLFFLLLFFLNLYISRDTIINVPDRPFEGYKEVSQLSDSEFINFAQDFFNLVGTFQPTIAEKQFETASTFLVGQKREEFKRDFLQTKLVEVRETSRTEELILEKENIALTRGPSGSNYVDIVASGYRRILIKQEELRPENAQIFIRIETSKDIENNQYGLYISDYKIR